MDNLIKLLTEAGYNETDIEKITGALKSSKYVPENYVPKARLDEVITERNNLREQVEGFNSQIDTLKKSAGDNEDLKKQIETLKQQQKDLIKENELKMELFYKVSAIKNEINDSVYDSDVVCGLLDLENITYNKDTKQIIGLKEQMDKLKETKQWMFKASENKPSGGGFVPKFGSQTDTPQIEKSMAMKLAEAITQKS